MVKLYKQQDGILHYWETWDTTPKRGIIHWGIVGERGAKKIIRGTGISKYQTLIETEINLKRAEGFAEPDKEYLLEIEYEAKNMNLNRLKKLHRLGERLDQLLGWTGLGHFDGNGFGFGKMDVTVLVVDFEIAKRVIASDLEDTEFAKYLHISQVMMDEDEDEPTAP
jgi:hypothetical protein